MCITDNTDQDYLHAYYTALAYEDEEALRNLDIPHSTVFFVRRAIFERTGEWYSLKRVEAAMKAEGMDP